jgi:hypothetical protein
MAANTTLIDQPLFYGNNAVHKKANELEPEEFLCRMEYIMGRTIPAPNDEAKISTTAANLRGPAHIWWSKTTPNTFTTAERATVTTNWDNFKAVFTKEYFTVVNKQDANLNFTGFNQNWDETAYNYLQRVNNAAQLFADMLMVEEDKTPPTLAVLPPAPEDNAAITDFNAIADERKQRLSNIFYKREFQTHVEIQKRYNNCLVLKIVMNGLREEKLKHTVGISARKDESIRVAISRLREAEVELEREKGNRKHGGNHVNKNGNNNSKKAKPRAIQGINPEEEEEDQESIDKITSSRNPKPKKKSKKREDIKKPTTTRCNFCNRPDHLERDCRTKADISKRLQERSKNRPPPQNGIQAQEGGGDGFYQGAGNA